ncbi:beta-lactamase family protein [Mycobacterium sp. 21AC1]|uniref:serine hydrolase domain-containing protein n=1 Tax=[Mycobacterium] appelbergii TaxID=2939269 RepID=UPI0029393D48|nr:serine hydrolase domain-containing protein [Mycobacterium sp. 21AC1]MDV3123446.1 beta-lactamase family protein [Mycobacterium sp. 21AC1]
MTDISGSSSPAFGLLLTEIQQRLDAGEELGLSLFVDIDGEPVVDVWGGAKDTQTDLAWERDTITNVFSITKTVTSLATLMLVDAGELDIDAPVAQYWPEFAAGGKENMTARHILSHSSGLSGLDAPVGLHDLYDSKVISGRLAAQAPWWEPGTTSGYHLLTYGYLLGELVRRITGLTLCQFVDERIAGPLGADFHIGVPATEAHRVADIEPPSGTLDLSALDPGSVAYRTLTGPALDVSQVNSKEWRAGEIGSANGHSNARGVGQVLSTISRSGAGPNGRVLGKSTVDLVFDEQTNGVDIVNGLDLRWGTGFALPSPAVPWIPEGRIAFWGGMGGSMAIMDVERGMTITYVMNRMGSDILGSDRSAAYVTAIYDAL